MNLTRESILSMEPGRELDKLVGEQVMGLDIVPDTLPYLPKYYLPDFNRTYFTCVPHYSTDISAAWEVVEKFDINTFNLNWLDGKSFYGEGWHCKLGSEHAHECTTAPEAICKAALLAKLEAKE